jgi:hypothetical protein
MLTNENFQDAVQSRIQKHIKSMGITFEPSDLALEIKKPVGYNPNRKRQSYQVDKYIPTLDIKDPRIQEFLQSNKLATSLILFIFKYNLTADNLKSIE